MTELQIVAEARRRRTHLFIWWIAWVPLGVVATWLSVLAFGPKGVYAAYLALIGWTVGAYWLMKRLTDLYCPHCGETLVRHPFFIVGHLECQHCGWRKENRG